MWPCAAAFWEKMSKETPRGPDLIRCTPKKKINPQPQKQRSFNLSTIKHADERNADEAPALIFGSRSETCFLKRGCRERVPFGKQIHNKLLKMMFHGYKTHTSVYPEPACVRGKSQGETQIFLLGSQHSGFLLASLCTAVPAYLSFPPIPNMGTLPAALISPATLMRARTATPVNPRALASFPCLPR